MRKVGGDQYVGCLIGQCLGDALGFVMEGQPTDRCMKYVEVTLRTQDLAQMKWGQYSDDSQLARELILSYVSRRVFDYQDYAHRIARIFSEGRAIGEGAGTGRAARRLIRGVPLEEAGEPPPYAGNGSAMRAAPIGLIYYDKPERLIQASHDQSRITHRDKRCSGGAIAIAGAVALALTLTQLRAETFCPKLAEWVAPYDAVLADSLTRQMRDWLELEPMEALPEISVVGLTDTQLNEGWIGISPFVTSSVLWSLYSFLRTPEDYWQSICTAISSGGDVDTTAAMSGAMAGARVGIKRIPRAWALRLTDSGEWGYYDLVELALQCYSTKHET
jgi:ADP-ribosylglycohydrolase